MTDSQTLYQGAIKQAQQWLEDGKQSDAREPCAVSLATATPDGVPSVRVVLVRTIDEEGFVFFTNAQSHKGQELLANMNAALCFYWDLSQRQLRVQGAVQQVTDSESDRYWERRSRLSQIASAVSQQSRTLGSRQEYEDAVRKLESELEGQPVPRPAHWHGFRVIPRHIEFWEGRDARMHVRNIYELNDGQWSTRMLYP